MNAPDYAVDLTDVTKIYAGRIHALRGVSMQVKPGEIFGLLGPNGAGKSTLVKILTTVIRPTRARGTLLGRPVGHKPTLARVGYLPEHHRFPEYLTGAQVIDFYGALAKTPRRERHRRTGELLELVGMTKWGSTKVRSYSKGMRQRVGIAQALVNEPDLILLDEPTDGVDPVGRRDIRVILQQLRDRGKTVFLNSHLLSELEMVCDRVAILVQGVVVSHGTIDELTEDRRHYEIEVAPPNGQALELAALPAAPGSWAPLPPDPAMAARAAGAAPTSVPRRACMRGVLPTGETIEVDDTVIRVKTTEAPVIQPVLEALLKRAFIIKTVHSVRPSLEDLFMQAVTDPITGQVLAPGAGQGPGARNPRRAPR